MNWHLYPIAEFKQYSDGWDRINKQGVDTPLLSSDFVTPLLNYFSNSNDKLAIHGDCQNPDAMAVVTKAKFGVWETLQPSQSPLGLWLDKTISTSLLLSQLRKDLPFPTLLFGVTQQDPDLLSRPDKSSGLSTLDYIQTARVTLNGSFQDYWSRRGKSLR